MKLGGYFAGKERMLRVLKRGHGRLFRGGIGCRMGGKGWRGKRVQRRLKGPKGPGCCSRGKRCKVHPQRGQSNGEILTGLKGPTRLRTDVDERLVFLNGKCLVAKCTASKR